MAVCRGRTPFPPFPHFLHFLPLLLLLPGHMAPAAPAAVSDERRAEVEADWLRQEEVRGSRLEQATPASDALGAVDGVKDGKWGFHTNQENQPWWQVDLGVPTPLARVLVFNRCDCASRADGLLLLLSDDGKSWRQGGKHTGPTFFGATDGKPYPFDLKGAVARFVRLQLPGNGFLHFDEVEAYGTADPGKNLALWQPALQSSISPWSVHHVRPEEQREPDFPVETVVERGRKLVADLREAGVNTRACERALGEVEAELRAHPPGKEIPARKALYLEARWAVRRLALSNPLLDFERILFVKRAPSSYSHMSDQHYGWWSRPGGGVFVMEGYKRDAPRLRCLTESLPEGSCIGPDLSYDGRKVLFAHCRHHKHVAGLADKMTKENVPEDAFYHIYEMGVDGKGLRQLTRGRYDDFDPRHLPNGDILFLSTRRGQFVQTGEMSGEATMRASLPDSYVRCGGGPSRPVAVYTLHSMDAGGKRMRTLSPFENFEWTPSVADDGRVLYARWDYVDRDNMPYMSLWSTNPDGTNPQAVYGNFTRNPHCIFEARTIPGSRKILFTASAHHAITGGSLVLLDPGRGIDGTEPITRLTPEVCFPEVEGWPGCYYASPYPLSERYYLTAWSDRPIRSEGGGNPVNATGIYLYDAFGNLELLYRDPEISSAYPLPLKPRHTPPTISSGVEWAGGQEGRFLLLDVYRSLANIPRGSVKHLRIVGVPAKTHPTMNFPVLGVTRDDPGKFILGTVPVEEDGSAHFRVPSGVGVFFQALDADGMALQTMRTLTYVQPGQTLACVGCHEGRTTTPPNARSAAASRPASRLTPGPEGSWPLRFDRLVQPVLDRHCSGCHSPAKPEHSPRAVARVDLSPEKAYDSLVAYGKPSLRDHVLTRYRQGRSAAGAGAARTSVLLALLRGEKAHHNVRLDEESVDRLAAWMDTYAQVRGSYSEAQEAGLIQLRAQSADLLEVAKVRSDESD